jgi:hypothetical protein
MIGHLTVFVAALVAAAAAALGFPSVTATDGPSGHTDSAPTTTYAPIRIETTAIALRARGR